MEEKDLTQHNGAHHLNNPLLQQNRPPLSLEELLFKSIYFVNEGPEIGMHISFEILKSFCIPEIYTVIITHIENMVVYAVQNYPTYNVYLNLKGITITSIDKYRDFIMKCSTAMLKHGEYYNQLQFIYVIQAPTFLKQLLTIMKTITPYIINNIKIVPNEKKNK
jgi:hypothetical protein